MNRDYIERRNYLKKLESLGFELTAQPEGAFYIFPSIKNSRKMILHFVLMCWRKHT